MYHEGGMAELAEMLNQKSYKGEFAKKKGEKLELVTKLYCIL
jgi:hypothetical protein